MTAPSEGLSGRARSATVGIAALTVAACACGRVEFADLSPPADAFEPPPPTRVISSAASGPNTLADAIAHVNGMCASLTAADKVITFDLPASDPAYRADGGNAYWLVMDGGSITVTCAGTVLDGLSQTARRGDTNQVEVGGMPVGAAGELLPVISAPEIVLRGVTIQLGASDVTVRGVAAVLVIGDVDRITLEDSWIGSEPTSLTPLPAALRVNNTEFYSSSGSQGHLIQRNLFVWNVGSTNSYNGISFGSGGPSVIRDNYFTGAGGGSIWDEVHLTPANGLQVLHNFLGGTSWEFHIEWVGGTGEIRENSYAAGPTFVRFQSGGSAVQSGNVAAP